jgi:hypothetical protein
VPRSRPVLIQSWSIFRKWTPVFRRKCDQLKKLEQWPHRRASVREPMGQQARTRTSGAMTRLSRCFQRTGAPKNTPREIIEKLNREINAGLVDPRIKARLESTPGRPRIDREIEWLGRPMGFLQHPVIFFTRPQCRTDFLFRCRAYNRSGRLPEHRSVEIDSASDVWGRFVLNRLEAGRKTRRIG